MSPQYSPRTAAVASAFGQHGMPFSKTPEAPAEAAREWPLPHPERDIVIGQKFWPQSFSPSIVQGRSCQQERAPCKFPPSPRVCRGRLTELGPLLRQARTGDAPARAGGAHAHESAVSSSLISRPIVPSTAPMAKPTSSEMASTAAVPTAIKVKSVICGSIGSVTPLLESRGLNRRRRMMIRGRPCRPLAAAYSEIVSRFDKTLRCVAGARNANASSRRVRQEHVCRAPTW
jgi:hypothetical protein